MEVAEIKMCFRGNNFITPRTINFGICGDNVYELSSGDRMMSSAREVFGVTVNTKSGDSTDLSQMFYSKRDAIEYIKELQHGSSN